MSYLLLLVQELLVIFEAFILGVTIFSSFPYVAFIAYIGNTIISFLISIFSSFLGKVLKLIPIPDFLVVLKLLKFQLVLFLDLQLLLFGCFSNTLPSGEYVNLVCSIILL